MSDDALGPITVYGKHLLQLGESQELLILNGLPCFPDSRFFTCRPYGGGVSVVDYVFASHNLLPFIRHLSVSPIPLADHALISFSLQSNLPLPLHPSPWGPPRTTFLFDKGDPERKILPSKTQFSLLDSASTKYTCLSTAIWEVALKSFPHSTCSISISPKVGSCPMNKWYDDECKTQHHEIRYSLTQSPPFYSNVKAS